MSANDRGALDPFLRARERQRGRHLGEKKASVSAARGRGYVSASAFTTYRASRPPTAPSYPGSLSLGSAARGVEIRASVMSRYSSSTPRVRTV